MLSCDADAQLLVDEQQVRVLLLGQLNGLAFSWVESRKCRIDLGEGGTNDQPGRQRFEPVPNRRNRPWVIEFVEDRGGMKTRAYKAGRMCSRLI